MTIHMNNRAAAVAKLTASRFTEISNGAWVSADRSVRATIHPTHAGEVVAVAYVEITPAA